MQLLDQLYGPVQDRNRVELAIAGPQAAPILYACPTLVIGWTICTWDFHKQFCLLQSLYSLLLPLKCMNIFVDAFA